MSLDVDGFTNDAVQSANIAYPAMANLLIKVAILAATVGKGLNQLCHGGAKVYQVGLSHLKQIALYYFNLKRKGASEGVLQVVLQRLWSETYSDVLPILNNLHQLGSNLTLRKHWPIRQLLHNRRAGIEPLIGHAKHGGQLGRSRIKSDGTTKSAGYAAVFGFNLRQLTRHIAGEVRPKNDKMLKIAANHADIDDKLTPEQTGMP